ncbi:hypothetical protein [Streptomyces indiaensis]|uniref:Uncharacterized protein n=1 Tax=Streptomyces indiaensis TaxID=284033 RepID=A0ABN3DY35_9ACTN|nr:hypothetical protein [Streptomyces indiaensis]MCF1649182.1 hypothetical protein [Streptomyces indiaensis]
MPWTPSGWPAAAWTCSKPAGGSPRVGRFGQVNVRGNALPVPVLFIGRPLRMLLHANNLIVFDGRTHGHEA